MPNKWHRKITVKLDNSNFPKFGIKINKDLIGLDIFIIDCVIGLFVLVLNKAKRILKVKINTKNDKIKSIIKNPNSGNVFDIIFSYLLYL